MKWSNWASVAEGRTTPGAPVTALPWGNDLALFISDPHGSIYTTVWNPQVKQGFWTSVAEGHTTPGAPVTALPWGNDLVLFISDPHGGIYTTVWNPQVKQGFWTSVAEGHTTPGAPVTALPWGNDLALFISDPHGGIYTTVWNPQVKQGFWTSVAEGHTTPGTPVTAMPWGNDLALFISDPHGGIYTTVWNPQVKQGFWTSVAEGRTTPGTPVTALPWGNDLALFISDPHGGIYTTVWNPQVKQGFWTSVAEGHTTPGAPVTAVPWGNDLALFISDPHGGVYTTLWSPNEKQGFWTSVAEGTSTPGAPVSAVAYGQNQVTLFLADPAGGVFTSTGTSEKKVEETRGFQLEHTLVRAKSLSFQQHSDDVYPYFTVSSEGSFPVRFAGRLINHKTVAFSQKIREKLLVMDWSFKIFTPGGLEFQGNEITRADLEKYRDLRGMPIGDWSYKLLGESTPIVDVNPSTTKATGFMGLSLIETVPNESAPPLIEEQPLSLLRQSFTFDLFRLGTFVAEISLPDNAEWNGTMRLMNADGQAVAQSTSTRLTFPIGLAQLRRPSSTSEPSVPKWTLEVSPGGGALIGRPHISATVIGSGRISVLTLKERIDALFGEHGKFIHLFGKNAGGEAKACLEIKDEVSAETIQMHDLLDGYLDDADDLEAFKVYTIKGRSENLAPGLTLDVSTLKVDTIDFDIGPGVRLGPTVPTVRLTVAVSGSARIEFQGATLATGKIRGGRVSIEVGIKVEPNGTTRIVTDIPNSPFDIDINNVTKAALLLTLGPLGLIGGLSITEYSESVINGAIVAGARRLFAEPTIAPRILMTIFGAHLTLKQPRFENDAIVFDYIAPVEPESRPSQAYYGAIGRSFSTPESNTVVFEPPTLGDTWRADNLTQKIDHIVVVMMENRSYDHVLGYRSLPPISERSDGLTNMLIEAIQATKDPNGNVYEIRDLEKAGFARNKVGRMTRLPRGVGHEVGDVKQQLSERVDGPSGSPQINSPKGFAENFRKKLKTDPKGCVANDVLGYYSADNLPFSAYLADNYAYCDRYFSSHPGPTLPNRMYSLTGDVQHDRYGFPILENNDGDNFLLSRAHTIYDLLIRQGLGFRVYESQPSATMLRLFARYATDRVNIVPFERLKEDISKGDLPAFTAIEPSLHHHPQNDDHPDADMHRGQIFLRDVYNTLRSNRTLWERTLLIITYDEHGGLYDHVVPPVADVYQALSNPPPVPLAIPYGVRVPTFVVSPWVAKGKGPSIVLDHCSILKTVLARFFGNEQPFLSDRVKASNSFEAFLSEAAPRMDVPAFTNELLEPPLEERLAPSGTTRIITAPLSRQDMRKGPVDFHDLTGRWARQLGR